MKEGDATASTSFWGDYFQVAAARRVLRPVPERRVSVFSLLWHKGLNTFRDGKCREVRFSRISLYGYARDDSMCQTQSHLMMVTMMFTSCFKLAINSSDHRPERFVCCRFPVGAKILNGDCPVRGGDVPSRCRFRPP